MIETEEPSSGLPNKELRMKKKIFEARNKFSLVFLSAQIAWFRFKVLKAKPPAML